MRPLTEQQLTRYNEIFPELAPEQLETAVLYAMGIPEKQIAYCISATDITVSKTLEKVKEIYKTDSVSHLRVIFQVRMFHFSIVGHCKNQDKQSIEKPKPFSRRENQVIYWVSMGKTYPEISMILGIKIVTVKFHIGNILKKLGVYNVKQAIRICVERNLIEPVITE